MSAVRNHLVFKCLSR